MKALKLTIAVLAFCGNGAMASQLYSLVQGIDKFDGSTAAWHLLEANGFVVADPTYRQVFEPYLDNSLPPFITTDSAWDTFQMLLAAGAKQFESKHHADADFFGNTVDPGNPGRATASGLDFFVGSADLRSPAAVKALRQMSGETAEMAAENLNYLPPSNSLAARALGLLAGLEKPVPDRLAPAFHSEAWADEQLWTQLGAWVEQGFPRQLQYGTTEGYARAEEGSGNGAVAPYPDFFSELAQLARDTGAAMERAGMDEAFDTRAVAQELLDGVFMMHGLAADKGEEMAKMSATRIQFNEFAGRYMETHHAGGGDNSTASQQLLKEFEDAARRCLTGDPPSEGDRSVLKSFYDERMTPPRLLREFAGTCDKLVELARKQIDGTPLSEEDEKWIAGYGMTLARFHFFPGNASTGAEDEFPIVRRLGTNAGGGSFLWAGLGHPEALYIILPAEGRLRLYRGAALAYREFAQPASDSLDDKSWRKRVHDGNVPPPPVFTASFRAEKSATDILETLTAEGGEQVNERDIQPTLEALQTRATDADLPALIGALSSIHGEWLANPVPGGIAAAIAKVNWQPSRDALLALIDKDDGLRAGVITSILLQRPEWLDGAELSTNFDHSPPRTRRVYAYLLGRIRATAQIRAALMRASRDDDPGVRWQGVMAVSGASWDAAQKIPPLLERLNDSNELVAAAAARGLGRVGTASVAPVLFSNLEQRLAAPAPGTVALREQFEAVQDGVLGIVNWRWSPFDSDNLIGRVQPARMRRFNAEARRDQFTDVSALIEALGDLRYQPAAETLLGLLDGRDAYAAAKALKKLAPEKLAGRLAAIAADKNARPQARDDAVLLLGDYGGASPMTGLIPLLDDQTVVPGVVPAAGRDWRICDRAATTLARLMGRAIQMAPTMSTQQRDQQVEQVRQWLKSAY